MKRFQPSLVRRLTIAFVISHAVALTLFIVALWPIVKNDDAAQLGPELAIGLIGKDVVVDHGRLALRGDAEIAKLAHRSPTLWLIVRARGQQLQWGPVPPEALRLMATASSSIKNADFGNIGHSGRIGDAAIDTVDTAAGHSAIAAGGIDPKAITFGVWLRFLFREAYVLLGVVTAVFTLLGGLIAIPVVLRSLRSTARAAAAIDGSDLQQRLPEQRVVKELLPIVRAFNAALDRVSETFERRRRFIADVAHELRTPLAVLNMHVEELPETAHKPDLQRIVFRLGHMVGQMLDAERLSFVGRKRERVDLVELARDSIANIAPLAIANGYNIALNTARDSVIVQADAHAVARALANLLGNAIAHGGGSGTIEVRVKADAAVEVADEGPGVPVEARERIFEPFYRERWDKDGCGLGLHLVREIMHAHGGSARLVAATPGAVFRLEFPE